MPYNPHDRYPKASTAATSSSPTFVRLSRVRYLRLPLVLLKQTPTQGIRKYRLRCQQSHAVWSSSTTSAPFSPCNALSEDCNFSQTNLHPSGYRLPAPPAHKFIASSYVYIATSKHLSCYRPLNVQLPSLGKLSPASASAPATPIMGKKDSVPDAWEDDWETQADRQEKEPDVTPPSPAKPLTQRERLLQHAERNRRLWEEA